jgi:hypothetical protein
VAGDVIAFVDGYDVRAERSYLSWTLLQVKQGTAVKLGPARGVEITITAGPPR